MYKTLKITTNALKLTVIFVPSYIQVTFFNFGLTFGYLNF